MSLYEIDHEATQRRLDEITSDGLRALRAVRQESEEIDKSIAELLENRELARQALDEQVKAAAQPVEPEPEAKPRPRPATLALGGDEFRQAREERQAVDEVRPAPVVRPPAPPEPEQKDEPQPRRTFAAPRRGGRPVRTDVAPVAEANFRAPRAVTWR